MAQQGTVIMEAVELLIQYIVVPICGVLWFMYKHQQKQATQIAVLQATTTQTQLTNDREFKELRESLARMDAKLDSIIARK